MLFRPHDEVVTRETTLSATLWRTRGALWEVRDRDLGTA